MQTQKPFRRIQAQRLLKFSTAVSFLGAGAVIFSLALAGCSDGSPGKGSGVASGVIGGEDLGPDSQDPLAKVEVALVMQTGGGEALCTGTLISSDIVLTAAHCVPDDFKQGQVQFGTRAGQSAIVRTITGLVRHPQYVTDTAKPGNHFDIGLVRFSGGIPDGFETARIAASPDIITKGLQTVFAGYGLNSHFFHRGSGQLRKGEFEVTDLPNEGEIEVQSRWRQAICNGDSGGGLMIEPDGKPIVIGVTSRTPTIGPIHCVLFAYFTSVPANAKWIVEAGQALRAKDPGATSVTCLSKIAESAKTAILAEKKLKGQINTLTSPEATNYASVFEVKFFTRKGCEGHVEVGVNLDDKGNCTVRQALLVPQLACPR